MPRRSVDCDRTKRAVLLTDQNRRERCSQECQHWDSMLRGSARALLSKVHCMPGRLRLALYRPQALLPQEYALQVKPCSWNHHRQFAEAAVAPKFDWDSLESSISSDEGKRDLASLRSTWIDVQQKFSSMSEVSRRVDTRHLDVLVRQPQH